MCLAFRNSCSQRAVFGGATNSKGIQSKKPANNRLIHILGHSCLAGTSVVRDLTSCLAVSIGDFQAHGCCKCCNIRRKVEKWFEKPEVIHPKLGRSHRVQARCFGITGVGHLFMFNFCSALAHIDFWVWNQATVERTKGCAKVEVGNLCKINGPDSKNPLQRLWHFLRVKKTQSSFQTSQAHSRWMNMDYPLSYAQLGGQEICRMKINDHKWGIKNHRVASWLSYLPGAASLFSVERISQECSWKGHSFMFKLCTKFKDVLRKIVAEGRPTRPTAAIKNIRMCHQTAAKVVQRTVAQKGFAKVQLHKFVGTE